VLFELLVVYNNTVCAYISPLSFFWIVYKKYFSSSYSYSFKLEKKTVYFTVLTIIVNSGIPNFV